MDLGDEDRSETINVRVPARLADSIESVYESRGFSSKSEFIRSALRDALSPERVLSESTMEDVSISEDQIKQGRTTSLNEIVGSLQGEPSQVSGVGGLVSRAVDNAEAEGINFQAARNQPKVVVIGVGGAGNNTVNRLHNIGIEGTETVAVNTDKQHLKMIEADTKILIGKSLTKGHGAGGDPSMGERAAEMARQNIENVVSNADLVFVTAGMGGGTGTGAAPVCAKIAKEHGAIVVGMVSKPFNVERARTVKAEEGLKKLRNEADSVIVLDNNQLLNHVPSLPIGKVFSVMDQIIAENLKGISETITQPSLVNLDYSDLASVFNQEGVGVMFVGETQDKNKTQEVVKDTMNHPLIDIDYRGASGGLIHITGGSDLTLEEAEEIAQSITERLEAPTNVIWGARTQEGYEGRVRISVIFTGISALGRGLVPGEEYGSEAKEEYAGEEDAEYLSSNRVL